MSRALLLAGALCLMGCGAGAMENAINVANAAHTLEEGAGDVLEQACTDEYKRAASAQRIAELDEECLPARKAYGALRAARLATVAAITLSYDHEDPALLLLRSAALANTARQLGAAVAALQEGP